MAWESGAGQPLGVTRAPARDGPVRELLDRAFDGQPGVLDEFPALLRSLEEGRSFVVCSGDRLVAHAAWSPLDLVSGDRAVAAAGIGLVTTAPESRGRGLASAVVEACVCDAAAAGAALVMLFAPTRSLYTRLGFRSAGIERITTVPARDACDAASGPGGHIRRATERDVPAMLELQRRHALRVERTPEELVRSLAIPRVDVRVYEGSGRVIAYCAVGKGRDLGGVVHEWAGEPVALRDLIRSLATGRTSPLLVLSPGAGDPPIEGEHRLAPLAQFRILDPDGLGTDDPARLLGTPESPPRLPIYVWGFDSV